MCYMSILSDLYKNSLLNQKKYTNRTIQLANDIYSISPQCFNLLKDNLNFPSKYIIDKNIGNEFKDIHKYFLCQEEADQIISLWEKKMQYINH